MIVFRRYLHSSHTLHTKVGSLGHYMPENLFRKMVLTAGEVWFNGEVMESLRGWNSGGQSVYFNLGQIPRIHLKHFDQ
jgi:hypothetical protein